MNDVVIRKATLADIDMLKELADTHKYELGFVRRPALIRSIERREVFVAENSAGVVGFVEYHHRQDAQTTLYHIVVCSEHRRLGIGRRLVQALVSDAYECNQRVISLKCPVGLESNHFYKQIKFLQVNVQSGKERALVVWQLSVNPPL